MGPPMVGGSVSEAAHQRASPTVGATGWTDLRFVILVLRLF